MPVHIAIVRPPYDRLILTGRKTIEARLTCQARAPFGRIAPGQGIYFKRSSGPFFASAVAGRVLMRSDLRPEDVMQLRRRYGRWIGAGEEWWEGRRHCRYATLIWLERVQPTTRHPPYRRQTMRAWYVLDGQRDRPVGPDLPPGAFEVELTAGAVNNRYVRLGRVRDRLPHRYRRAGREGRLRLPMRLCLQDGPTVETELLLPAWRVRWRGWGAWFAGQRLSPGDRLRFLDDGRGGFVVQPVRMT